MPWIRSRARRPRLLRRRPTRRRFKGKPRRWLKLRRRAKRKRRRSRLTPVRWNLIWRPRGRNWMKRMPRLQCRTRRKRTSRSSPPRLPEPPRFSPSRLWRIASAVVWGCEETPKGVPNPRGSTDPDAAETTGLEVSARHVLRGTTSLRRARRFRRRCLRRRARGTRRICSRPKERRCHPPNAAGRISRLARRNRRRLRWRPRRRRRRRFSRDGCPRRRRLRCRGIRRCMVRRRCRDRHLFRLRSRHRLRRFNNRRFRRPTKTKPPPGIPPPRLSPRSAPVRRGVPAHRRRRHVMRRIQRVPWYPARSVLIPIQSLRRRRKRRRRPSRSPGSLTETK